MRLWIFACLATALGCSSHPAHVEAAADDAATVVDAAADLATDVPVDTAADASKAATCASTFGTALTAPFGRADGTVVAIVGPTDTACAWPNSDHLVVQMRIGEAIYRMVINVESDRGADLRVRYTEIEHAMPAPAWAEGWHTGLTLDYPSMLDAHATAAFTAYEMAPLVTKVTDAIPLGAKVSVYAATSGGASAHKVHRNTAGTNQDGAIVIEPTSAKPRWLLFHFADQTF